MMVSVESQTQIDLIQAEKGSNILLLGKRKDPPQLLTSQMSGHFQVLERSQSIVSQSGGSLRAAKILEKSAKVQNQLQTQQSQLNQLSQIPSQKQGFELITAKISQTQSVQLTEEPINQSFTQQADVVYNLDKNGMKSEMKSQITHLNDKTVTTNGDSLEMPESPPTAGQTPPSGKVSLQQGLQLQPQMSITSTKSRQTTEAERKQLVRQMSIQSQSQAGVTTQNKSRVFMNQMSTKFTAKRPKAHKTNIVQTQQSFGQDLLMIQKAATGPANLIGSRLAKQRLAQQVSEDIVPSQSDPSPCFNGNRAASNSEDRESKFDNDDYLCTESFDGTSQQLKIIDGDGGEVKQIDENSAFNILFNNDSMKSMPVLAKQSSMASQIQTAFKFSLNQQQVKQNVAVPPLYKKTTNHMSGAFKLVHNRASAQQQSAGQQHQR
ncbi:hypothetical protein FGO68_gene6942 [Halteria grandinella]|uniref:Uncharacterized protein n=1 Tax=Halteria grandinella TaxID=5974 RepID=A0A8J8P257_HALGN|nr:hypothetical protein FGO68_gene6942 [Halteria grandinella]